MPQISQGTWIDYLTRFPNAHILQTATWGQLKNDFDWEAIHVISGHNVTQSKCGAQVLFRRLPLGMSLAYIPRGPVGSEWDRLWPEVDNVCRAKRAIFLKIEPDIWSGSAAWKQGTVPDGFKISPQSIQPPRTVVVDLSGSEQDILGSMKQKTRYNIRLAVKKEIQVKFSDDVDAFYELMETTSLRDQFGIHSHLYYQTAYDLFHEAGKCELLMAEYDGEPVAGLMVFVSGNRSWYLYGASSSIHRERMPTYLLQWEAMKWARSKGCLQYDLYGVPDHDADYLEANFQEHSQGLWGIYRFKRGFGGKVIRSPGPWDRVYNSFLYQIYLRWIARTGVED